MLVLTRKPGEFLKLGSEVVVKIVAVKGKRVTVAIAAPESIRIRRGEAETPATPNSTEPMLAELSLASS